MQTETPAGQLDAGVNGSVSAFAYAVKSFSGAAGALAETAAIPFSIDAGVSYISLLPIT